MGRLKGKTAIITGGASGIGHAIAQGFAAEGASIWIADIDDGAASAAASAIGEGARAIAIDVARQSSVAAAVDQVTADGAGIDILVNAAGIYKLEPWLEVTEAGFDQVMQINARGLLFMTQAVAHKMIAQSRGGAIVNIASGGGRRGDPVSVVYSASKAAVISLTQSAALAFAPHAIRVNAIAPGPVATPMWAQVTAVRAVWLGQQPDDIGQAMRDRVPLGRISTADEQVGAAIFLCSHESAYVTGQTLNVDGGLFMN